MFNDIDWTMREKIQKICISNAEQGKNYVKRFSRGHRSFPGPGDEEKLNGPHTYKPEGKWDSIAADMVEHVKETGHPVFKGISALSRGILKRNGHRTQKTCFAQFTQQMSSVSTEQYQAGVKRLLSGFRVKLS